MGCAPDVTATDAVTAAVLRGGCGHEGRLSRGQRHEVADAAELGPVGRVDRRVSGRADDMAGEFSGERGDVDVVIGSEPGEGGMRCNGGGDAGHRREREG